MPAARGLFHRAIIESGAVLRLTTQEDAVKQTDLLLAELGLKAGQVRELQAVPMPRLLEANAAVQKRITLREPGMTASTPMVSATVNIATTELQRACPAYAPSTSSGTPAMVATR